VTTPALVVDGVRKRYGRQVVLDGVSFSVPRGAIYGLIGPNGAGKTTLFSVVAGFVRAEAGRVRVLDHELAAGAVPPALFGRVGILPQDALYQANIPIAEQLQFFLRLAGRAPRGAAAEVRAALDRVGLGDWLGGQATALSHGMHKRLGLAQAFLGDPDLLLLDEPTAGLDPANADTIRGLIRACRKRDATVVVSSHDLAELEKLCDHVCILRQGRVVSQGPMAAVGGTRLRSELALSRALSADERSACTALPGVLAIDELGLALYRIEVLGADQGDAAMAALFSHLLKAGVVPRSLAPGGRLEQHFREVTGDAPR